MNLDVGILVLRVVVGLLFVGHGAQKLFGWFGGKGMEGQVGIMQRLGIQPTHLWAYISALGEFLGGLGLALGLLTPLAAAAIMGAMLVAIVRVHWPKGVWNSNGGIEFPLVMGVVAFVVGLVGPGLFSLDQLFNLALPEPLTYAVALVAMLLGVGAALRLLPRQPGEVHRPA
jgi:putative oxidoreductase